MKYKKLLPLLSFCLLTLSLRSWSSGLLALIALLPLLLYLIHEKSPWKSGLSTFLTASAIPLIGLEGTGTSWPTLYPVIVFVSSMWFFLVGILQNLVLQHWGQKSIILFPVFWVAIEAILTTPVFSGSLANPTPLLAYTQGETPLLYAAILSGTAGTSLIVCVFNVMIFLFIYINKNLSYVFGGIIVSFCIFSLIFQPKEKANSQLSVGLVQPHITKQEVISSSLDLKRQKEGFYRMGLLAKEARKNGAEVVVMPESVFGLIYPYESGEVPELPQFDFPVIVGANLSFKNGSEVFNSVLQIGKNWSKIYNKQITVPFFERKIIPGNSPGFFTAKGLKFATFICWENAFPYLSRDASLAKADVIVYLNNLTWAGYTETPRLHATMSAFRSVELAKPVLSATINGPSYVFNFNGNVLGKIQSGKQDSLAVKISTSSTITPFVHYGNWIGIISLILSFSTIILVLWSKFYRYRPAELPTLKEVNL
jgi:apolipoprotein N-acyltransferase